MPARSFRKLVYAGIVIVALLTPAFAQTRPRARTSIAIPTNTLLQIIRAEDQRRWDDKLKSLLSDKDPTVRTRAALAAGRIGDERAVLPLIDLLKKDTDWGVQQTAAFALGEIESAKATDALIEATRISDLRARALEALGKIAAVLPQTEEPRRQTIGQVVLDALVIERKEAMPTAGGVRDSGVELFGLTAVLRARPTGAGKVVALYLSSPDPRVRADALNTLARLRLKDGNDQARHMLDDSNPIVRANAARVLGATEDKEASEALLDRALHDDDLRVRVSAIRALGSLKDARAVKPLLDRGQKLLKNLDHVNRGFGSQINELLEIATTLGRISQNTNDREIVQWLVSLRGKLSVTAPETEVAFARVAPETYTHRTNGESVRPRLNNRVVVNSKDIERTDLPILISSEWRQATAVAQGLAEIAKSDVKPDWIAYGLRNIARDELDPGLRCHGRPLVNGSWQDSDCLAANAIAVPEMLRAFSLFKPANLDTTLKSYLSEKDVIIRATAAELLGEQPPSEPNARALVEALPQAL